MTSQIILGALIFLYLALLGTVMWQDWKLFAGPLPSRAWLYDSVGFTISFTAFVFRILAFYLLTLPPWLVFLMNAIQADLALIFIIAARHQLHKDAEAFLKPHSKTSRH